MQNRDGAGARAARLGRKVVCLRWRLCSSRQQNGRQRAWREKRQRTAALLESQHRNFTRVSCLLTAELPEYVFIF